MYPKIEATVDARDRKVADALASAKAAHSAADNLEDRYRQQSDAARAAAQTAVPAAKDTAARDAETRLAKVHSDLPGKLAAPHHDGAAARPPALAESASVEAGASGGRVAHPEQEQ